MVRQEALTREVAETGIVSEREMVISRMKKVLEEPKGESETGKTCRMMAENAEGMAGANHLFSNQR